MKNNLFTGWSSVFAFTLKQAFTKAYKYGTVLFALALLLAGIGANLFLADRQKKEEKISPVEKVYVYDESNIEELVLQGENILDEKRFPSVIFEQATTDFADLGIRLGKDEGADVITRLTASEKGYQVCVYVPDGSSVKKEDARNLAKAIRSLVRQSLIASSGIEEEKVTYIVSGTHSEFLTAGENARGTGQRVLTAVLPIFLMLFMYFMILIYGQNMGNIVTVEKSSKLMETLLLMTRPYGIIFGKIFATAFTAICQILVWGACVAGGFFAGDAVAKQYIYPEYENFVFELLNQMATDDSLKAFTPEAVALGVLAICVAFLFYCVLAGAIASFAGKAEELGQVMMFYNMFLVIGFMGSHILPNSIGKEWVKVILRIIPLSSAFLLPGEIIVGTVPVLQGALYLLLLMAWILGLCVFAGRVYKNQMFYKGKSLLERMKLKKEKETETEERWQVLVGTDSTPDKNQRLGYFFAAVAPLILVFVLQLLASVVVMNVLTRVRLQGIDVSAWETKDYVDLYKQIENILNPLTLFSCHLCITTFFGIWFNCFLKKEPGLGKQSIVNAWRNIKTDKPTGPLIMVLISIVLGVALCFFANGTVVVETYLLPDVVGDYLESGQATGFGGSVFGFLAAVVLAPVGEEFLCRGVCQRYGKKAFGNFWMANLLQALGFGLIHANWVQGIYAFIIGLVLGYMAERYDSLLPGMLIHFVVNFSSSTWAPYVMEDLDQTMGIGILLMVIPMLIAAPMLVFIEKKHKGATS